MIRILFTAFAVSITTAAMAGQPMPMAMPGAKAPPAEKPPAAKAPPASHPSEDMALETDSDNFADGCFGRVGVFRRLASLWCGHRHAYLSRECCNSSFPEYGDYTPVYSTTECGRLRLGCRDRCRVRCREHRRLFGFGRFCFAKRCDDGDCRRQGASGRLRAWLTWRSPCREKTPHCCLTPSPYQSPVRYYFQGDSEQACVSGSCATGPHGECAGAGLSAGVGNRLRGEGLGSRVRGKDGDDGSCGKGRCRDREQCLMTGQPFQGDLRFANNEKPKVPNIDASKPYFYGGYWHGERFGTAPREANQVQQASHKPQK